MQPDKTAGADHASRAWTQKRWGHWGQTAKSSNYAGLQSIRTGGKVGTDWGRSGGTLYMRLIENSFSIYPPPALPALPLGIFGAKRTPRRAQQAEIAQQKFKDDSRVLNRSCADACTDA